MKSCLTLQEIHPNKINRICKLSNNFKMKNQNRYSKIIIICIWIKWNFKNPAMIVMSKLQHPILLKRKIYFQIIILKLITVALGQWKFKSINITNREYKKLSKIFHRMRAMIILVKISITQEHLKKFNKCKNLIVIKK